MIKKHRWRIVVLGVLLVGAVTWTSWSRRTTDLTSILATAEQQLARQDYPAALRTLESAPASLQSDERFQVLRARAHASARRGPDDRSRASTALESADALRGFRILIYPLAGNRAEEARAQALERKLLELVPADVEVRPHTRESLKELGPAQSDELRFDTSLMLDERAARALQGIMQKAALGEFTLRHGRDRGAGTLYIFFAGVTTRSSG